MMEEYEQKEQEKAERKEAGKKTAHVAGKALAGYYGGTAGSKAYDALSNTKLGQKLESKVGDKVAKTPILGKANKKLDDEGIVDAADQAVDALNSSNGMKGSKKTGLKNTSNSNSKIPQALKNKNHNQGLRNRFLNMNNSGSSSNPDSTDSDGENDNNYQENETSLLSKKTKIILLKKYMPVLIGAVAALFILLIIILIVVELISPIMTFFGLEKGDDSSYIYNSNNNLEMSAAEKKYNETLLKTIDEFKEKYGVTIDKYLLHGTISYKYLTGSLEGLYDSNSGITDNDFTSSLESLKNEQESEEEEKTGIEYSEATKKIAVVAALMISKNSDGSYSTDAKRGGIFYNNLVQSSFLESYYADFLKDNTEETKKKLVDDIFDYAELAREMLVLNTIKNVNVVSNNISVYLQSCKPSYNYKTISGVKVFDNKLVNEGTEYPLYLSLRDYVKGNIMGEVGVSLDPKLKEYIKTQAVLGLSFMLADSRTGFNLKTGEIYYPTQTCRQVTCDPTYGCISVEGVASYSGLDRNYSGRKIKPLTEEQNAYLDEILDEVFGVVIAKPGVTADTFSGTSDVIAVNYCSSLYGVCPSCHAGTCVGQNQAKKDSQNGMTYDQIIAKYITGKDYELVNISEGLYYETTKNYEGQIELNENFYYNQGKYSNTTICSGEGSLRTYGCSVVSTAISVSLLTGEKHDPIEINSKLKSTGSCGGSASRYNNMINGAELYNLKTYKVNKGDKTKIDQMLSDLSSGNSVVTARIAPNAGQGARYSTKNGHYIVLVGTKTVDGRTKVLVWDPGNTSSSRHNYWADFEQDIEKWVNTGPSYVVMSR